MFNVLLQEQKTLLTGRNLLTNALQEMQEAIMRLREIKRALEHDWSDKQETMQIDHACAKLQIQPESAQFKVFEDYSQITENLPFLISH